jgi:hypothetical protein
MKSNEHRETVMNCLQCHNPLPVTANFCGKCGTTVPGKNKKPIAKALDDAPEDDAPAKEEGIDLLAYVKHQKATIPGQTEPDQAEVELAVAPQASAEPAPQAPAADKAVSEAAVQLMDDLKAQIDAVGISAPVKAHMIAPEFEPPAPAPAPAPAPVLAAAVAPANLPPELAAQWQDMMKELRERMEVWSQQVAVATDRSDQLEPMRAWHDVQDVLEVQGRQLQDLMGHIQGLAANEQVQALREQVQQWQADNERARQEEAQKIPQVESNLVVYQNEQMQALGQLQQELRAFALAGAQSAGRLMAIEQAVSQLQSRLGVEPGHAVPPVAALASVQAAPSAPAAQAVSTQMVVTEPLEKVERVSSPSPKPAWVNGLMVGAIVVVLVLTAVLAGMAVYNLMSYSSLKASASAGASAKAKPERAERAKDAHP